MSFYPGYFESPVSGKFCELNSKQTGKFERKCILCDLTYRTETVIEENAGTSCPLQPTFATPRVRLSALCAFCILTSLLCLVSHYGKLLTRVIPQKNERARRPYAGCRRNSNAAKNVNPKGP